MAIRKPFVAIFPFAFIASIVGFYIALYDWAMSPNDIALIAAIALAVLVFALTIMRLHFVIGTPEEKSLKITRFNIAGLAIAASSQLALYLSNGEPFNLIIFIIISASVFVLIIDYFNTKKRIKK